MNNRFAAELGSRFEANAGALADRFVALTGQPPEGIWQAPGRVNLIGEHTDYNSGFALPFAIDRQMLVALRRRSDSRARVWSSPQIGHVEADLGDLAGPVDRGGLGARRDLGGPDGLRQPLAPWARYPVGVLWAFGQAGVDVPGVDIVIASTVPAGRGLSSSAALEAAVAVAVDELGGLGLDRRAVADLCQRAETEFVGAPVGLLDQLAVLLGQAGQGLLIDFRSLDVAVLPLAIGPLVVVDTMVRHDTADGGYAARRQACQQAAAELGVASLREATADMVGRLSGKLWRRARHVVTENQRVVETARLLREGTGAGIGELLLESHASLRDDFEVSCPELDLVVATARDVGATGARLTGAGFGGCAIVLGLDAGTLDAALAPRFRQAGWRQPDTFTVLSSDGAGRLV